jgi:hypothetical protein
VFAMDKQSSIFCFFISEAEKSFIRFLKSILPSLLFTSKAEALKGASLVLAQSLTLTLNRIH